MNIKCLSLCISILFFPLSASGAQEEFIRIKIFSGITFNAEQGDTVGLEIAIIPYGLGEKKVLFRLAESRLDAPLLFDLKENKVNKSMTFVIKSDHFLRGEWNIIENKRRLLVTSPIGEKIILRRVY